MSSKKILITGANGFLGRHLTEYLSVNKNNVAATGKGNIKGSLPSNIYYADIDITNANAVQNSIATLQPDVIVHTAAISKPDECEDNKDLCDEVNVKAVQSLLNSCKANTHFIFTSTDFIFGNDGLHSEDDEPSPLNYYGLSKLKAEQYIKENSTCYTIIRPVFMYGHTIEGIRASFVQWVANNLKENKPIKVVNDQQRKPTYVKDVCAAIETIIQQKLFGTFNICGDEILTPYQMAIAVANYLQLNKTLITPVDKSVFKEKAIRANNSLTSNAKAKQAFSFTPISFTKQGIEFCFNYQVE